MTDWGWIDCQLRAARAFIPTDAERDALAKNEQSAYEGHLAEIRKCMQAHDAELKKRGFASELKVEANGLRYRYSLPGFYGPAGFESSFHPAGRLVLARVIPGQAQAVRPNDLSENCFLGRDFSVDQFCAFVQEDLARFLLPENQIISEMDRKWLRSREAPKALESHHLNFNNSLEKMRLASAGTPRERQKRGRDFEVFLGRLINRDGATVRLRLRPTGEEIDGSFDTNGRIHLLEAKWHANPLPASAIYQFKGKVDGKLVGTIGIFISMSGYSKDAVDAVTVGKDLNVLLMDNDDIEASVKYGFSRVLASKLRAAVEEEVILYPFVGTDGQPVDEEELGKSKGELILLGEGLQPLRQLGKLAERALRDNGITVNVRCVAAHGLVGIPRVANALSSMAPHKSKLLLIVDEIDEHTDLFRKIGDELDQGTISLIGIRGSIDDWFRGATGSGKQVGGDVEAVDLDALASANVSANEFLSVVIRLGRSIQ